MIINLTRVLLLLVLVFGVFYSCYNRETKQKKEIEEYHQFRIEEFKKYHNYDTSYEAAEKAYYIGHDNTPNSCNGSYYDNNTN